jgi:hypothetical protein
MRPLTQCVGFTLDTQGEITYTPAPEKGILISISLSAICIQKRECVK